MSQRQYVRFAFYTLDPAWRRLPVETQAAQKRDLVATIEGFNRRMLLRPYSLMGTRADAELLLWQIAESPLPFQELATALMRTEMGAYLTLSYSYFSQTKRSIYEIRDGLDDDIERLIVEPTDATYLFVYPFIKTRDWYQMSLAARQGMMDEHITVGRKYPAIKLNTTYAFGLDDYEFIVAFETDEPSDFLDLVQELRETEASRYTLQDTPLFTCISMRLVEALDALGGPAIAEPIPDEGPTELATEVCPVDDLPEGESRIAYLDGKQIAVFNTGGRYYAISNRCSHARGPLAEGEVVDEPDGGCAVICPWHYGKFDLETGQPLDGVVSAPVPRFAVEVRDGMIIVLNTQEEPA
jgi:chlorite dismutase